MDEMKSDRIRVSVSVTGVVQGVGFRPFVYRTAVAHDLAGWVKNTGDAGVEIALEGSQDSVNGFLDTLELSPPPLSRIDEVTVEQTSPKGDSAFEIVASSDSEGGSGTIPPDTGMCDSCLEDVRDPNSRYYEYWGTSCVDCGPRYTVIRDLPYDRPTTSMDEFPMCETCREEYEDPSDRRYHAQTIACPSCGPTLSLLTPDGNQLTEGPDAIRAAGKRLQSGDILAIKGIGGTHLACDATDVAAVERLRERTGRPAKPFALMAPSLDNVETFARIDPAEAEALERTRRPIVLLDKAGGRWLEAIAPGLHTVGVMLSYSGLHHLLFDHVDVPLVLTSANHPGRPMCLTRKAILDRLDNVVDGVLDHDREIVARCDDSVVRFSGGKRRFIRRSRGWVPQRLSLPSAIRAGTSEILALGAEFDATIAVTQDEDVIPSQHVGDVDTPDTLDHHREVVTHLTELLGVVPEVVACDAHPAFLTTDEARRYANEGLRDSDSLDLVEVYHHHAHGASLLGEHDEERAIVITADGTGYGPDGTIWGGEVLDVTLGEFERVGGLDTFGLPGGEAAINRPARILASLIPDWPGLENLLVSREAADDHEAAAVVRKQANNQINVPETTSAGRFLDAMSALLDVSTVRHYEGEPAMKLESVAVNGNPIQIEVPVSTRDGTPVVDVAEFTEKIAELEGEERLPDLAATVQTGLADGLAEVAIDVAHDRDLDAVGFTGGVAYNDAIVRRIRERVRNEGLRFLSHTDVPPGDAGISYGQTVVAARRS